MSTREKVLQTISFLTDDQVDALYALLTSFCPSEIPNEETLAAFAELEDMKKHPERYAGYSDLDSLFEELNA